MASASDRGEHQNADDVGEQSDQRATCPPARIID